MHDAKLTTREAELMAELSERGLLDKFIDGAQRRLFEEFRTGSVETRRHTGYALDALKILGVEIQATMNEAIRNVRGSSRSAGSGAGNDTSRAA